MVKVYYTTPNGGHRELIATFESEALYFLCLPTLKANARENGYIITESIDED